MYHYFGSTPLHIPIVKSIHHLIDARLEDKILLRTSHYVVPNSSSTILVPGEQELNMDVINDSHVIMIHDTLDPVWLRNKLLLNHLVPTINKFLQSSNKHVIFCGRSITLLGKYITTLSAGNTSLTLAYKGFGCTSDRIVGKRNYNDFNDHQKREVLDISKRDPVWIISSTIGYVNKLFVGITTDDEIIFLDHGKVGRIKPKNLLTSIPKWKLA